jgi:hypothetical protein
MTSALLDTLLKKGVLAENEVRALLFDALNGTGTRSGNEAVDAANVIRQVLRGFPEGR